MANMIGSCIEPKRYNQEEDKTDQRKKIGVDECTTI
jgi:hypothetical protein